MAWLQFDNGELINLDNILAIKGNDLYTVYGGPYYIAFITPDLKCYKEKTYESKERAVEAINKLKLEILKGTPLIYPDKL